MKLVANQCGRLGMKDPVLVSVSSEWSNLFDPASQVKFRRVSQKM